MKNHIHGLNVKEVLMNKTIIIVLDSLGVGELPDAALFGDVGSNTLGHIAEAVKGIHLPNLERLGLGKIIPILGLSADTPAIGAYGKMAELSKGKDSTAGHWEMSGIITEIP